MCLKCAEAYVFKRFVVQSKIAKLCLRCSESSPTLVDLIQSLREDFKADKAERQRERAADMDLIQRLREDFKADKAERQQERAADKAERQQERAADKVELKELLKSYEPLWNKAAAHYELSVRTYIMNRRKIDDVGAFKCQSVQQLAEICLPTGYEYNQENATKIAGIRTSAQLGARATNLAKIALKQISTLRNWMKSASKNKDLSRKYNVLKNYLSAYDSLHSNSSSPTSEEAKLQYLRDDRLGFFAFTSAILADQELEGFVEELEIDFRLSPTVMLRTISLFVGEIKSGSGGGTYELSLYQVIRRLGVLYMAGRHSLGDHAAHYSFVGVGEIISPNAEWNDPTKDLIEVIKKTAGIVEYPPALLITVEAIA